MIFGFDPGGKSGVALLSKGKNGGLVGEVATVHSVEEAFAWVCHRSATNLRAAGIDTLISWSVMPKGWRPMDVYLRKTYPEIAKSVVASNGLYGSMGIQGMAMALLLRKRWPKVTLNETHPKVQYFAEAKCRYQFSRSMIEWLQQRISWTRFPEILTDHEWDALFSAVITHQALSSQCRTDLIEKTQAKGSLLFPAGKCHYFWL